MDSFANFVKDSYGRKFVGLEYDNATRLALLQFCTQHGLDLSVNYFGEPVSPLQFDFHTTVYYSVTECTAPLSNGHYALSKPVTVSPSHFAILGPKQNCLCLILKVTPELDRLRTIFGKRYGLKDTWPTYKPHITLTYNYTGGNFPPMPNIPLIADKLKVAAVNQ